jgi:hypothetical protein
MSQIATVTAAAAAAESLVNDAERVFDDASLPVGSMAAQGDLYMVRLAELPAGAAPRSNRQMAEGDTQGSRHVLELGNAYDCPAEQIQAAIRAVTGQGGHGVDVNPRYIGPVFKTEGQGQQAQALLTHPEHGDHRYQGQMVCAVVYQRNLDAEGRERRVED